MKKVIGLFFVFVLVSIFVGAHGEETFAEAEELIDSKISCDDLSDDQLAVIGDFYMEQMHPGEAHEVMDEAMGGEGSESLRQMHINMARSFYCGEHGVMTSGMMDTMMGRSSGMIGTSSAQQRGGMMQGFGMMTGGGFFYNPLIWFLYIAIAGFVFGVVFWWTQQLFKKKKR